MQSSARPQDTREIFVQPNPDEAKLPDPAAVLRAYGAGVGLPSDRWKLDLQARLVGAVIFVLAGVCLIMTVVLVFSMWLPAWLVTLGLTVGLTGLGLALFASVSRPPIYAPVQIQSEASQALAQDVSAIEEIDPTEVESMRSEDVAFDPRELERQRLTPHPIIATEAVDDTEDERDSDADDAKTRPLAEPPPAPSGRKALRAELPSMH